MRYRYVLQLDKVENDNTSFDDPGEFRTTEIHVKTGERNEDLLVKLFEDIEREIDERLQKAGIRKS